jgi:hypothetical protein
LLDCASQGIKQDHMALHQVHRMLAFSNLGEANDIFTSTIVLVTMIQEGEPIVIRPFNSEDQRLVYETWVDGFADTTWQGRSELHARSSSLWPG